MCVNMLSEILSNFFTFLVIQVHTSFSCYTVKKTILVQVDSLVNGD